MGRHRDNCLGAQSLNRLRSATFQRGDCHPAPTALRQALALLLIAAGLLTHVAAHARDHQPVPSAVEGPPQVVFKAPEELAAYQSRLERLPAAALLRVMDVVGLDSP